MRAALSHLLAGYVGAGLFGGLLMKMSIPALNPIGVVFYALTWPAFVYCAPTSRNCNMLESIPTSIST